MGRSKHGILDRSLLAWAFWVCYTCVQRAQNNLSWWHLESYAVNKKISIRILNVLVGILLLAIAFAIVFERQIFPTVRP